MNEITKIVTSPAWWVTAVLASLVINLFSSYLTKRIDGIVGRFSERRREANNAANTRRRALVAQLRNDRDTRVLHRISEARDGHTATIDLVLGFFLLVVAVAGVESASTCENPSIHPFIPCLGPTWLGEAMPVVALFMSTLFLRSGLKAYRASFKKRIDLLLAELPDE